MVFNRQVLRSLCACGREAEEEEPFAEKALDHKGVSAVLKFTLNLRASVKLKNTFDPDDSDNQ